VQQVGVRRRRNEADAGVLQPYEHVGRARTRHGQGEDGALARADDVGVPPVGHRVGGDDRRDAGGVGRPHHGTEVARLLDALTDQDQRVLGQREAVETTADGRDDGEEAVRPLAVGDPLERRPADPDRLDPVGAEVVDEPGLLHRVEHELGAVEDGPGPDAGTDGQGELLVALDDGDALGVAGPAAAQGDERLEARVRR
jgi:hypothetical protein